MRVLLFPKEFPSSGTPGAGIFILRRAQALRELGVDVHVIRIVPHAPPLGAKWQRYRDIPQDEDVDGIPVRTIRALFPPRMIAMEHLGFQVQRSLRGEIRRLQPDVINASFLIPNGQIAVHQDIPAVVTAHGSDAYAWPHRRRGLMRAAQDAVRNAAAVTAVSGFIADRVRRLYDREVEVIWNGGDERFFFPRDRGEAREALALPQGRLIIAFAGNLLRAKGLYELLEAAHQMRDLSPLIVLAGIGPEDAALQKRAADLGVDLQLRGRLDSTQVGELFSAADIVTLPSHAEGLPNVVCEAMLNGNAVVATTVGGTPEIVADGRTGLLVPPHDVGALAAALRRVAEDEPLRRSIEQQARAFACDHLTWRISAQRYAQVYRRAANASG